MMSRWTLITFGIGLLTSSCTELQPIASRQQPVVQGPARFQLAATVPSAPGQELVRRSWGEGPLSVGRRPEASWPGPMSLTLDQTGGIHLLDQVNRRLLRFDAAGAPTGELPLEAETAEDLVVAGERTFVLYYEPGVDPGYRLVAQGPAGEVLQRQRLQRGIQLATGLFATGPPAAPELWVERRHLDAVRVAVAGRLLPEAEQTLVRLGRSGRSGTRMLVRVEGNRASLRQVLAGRYTSLLLELEAPAPVAAVDDWLIGEDRVLLSLWLESGSGLQRRLVLWRRGQGRLAEWQMPSERAADALRTLALAAGGRVVSLQSDPGGLSLRSLLLDEGQP